HDYGLRAPKQSSDEVGELVDGFNGLLERIQVREQELHVARFAAEGEAARLAQVLSSVAWILIAVDQDGRVTPWNAAAEAAFGIPAAQAVGGAFTESGITWDWPSVTAWIDATLEGNRSA